MCEQKKNYNLLRPFDLEAAKRGDFVQTTGDDEIGKFVAENASEIVIDFSKSGFVIYEADDMCQLRMAPLCWVEGRPVYKGDVLFFKDMLGAYKRFEVFYDGDSDTIWSTSGWMPPNALTWTPPKVKREGWVNIYSQALGELVASVSHAHATKEAADAAINGSRTACVRIEWEE